MCISLILIYKHYESTENLFFFSFIHKNLIAETFVRKLMTGLGDFQKYIYKKVQVLRELSAAEPYLNILTPLPGKSCFVLHYFKGDLNIIPYKCVANITYGMLPKI